MTAAADLSLARWLPERAALTPDRVAIEFGDQRISYAELAAAAAARAARFAAAGLNPGDRVATLARNCPEQVAVFFACAMSGLVLVPLNWRLTAPELAYQLSDADPAVLLTESSLEALGKEAAAAAGCEAASLTIQGPTGAVPEISTAQPFGNHPLLILYTSGTTGRPKGAVLTHANCFWTNLSLDRTADLAGNDVVLQVLPQCHIGGWNVQPLLAWWKGAKVVLEQSFDAGRVLDLIQRKRITTMMGVPTNYLMLAAHPDFAMADLSSLRQVIVGGAPMPRPLLETWLGRGVTILQGYGLTEAAPNVLCVPAEYARQKTGSAGRPYLHVQVALRDLSGSGHVTGPGTGELLVAGPNVFAGYWRNPRATEAALAGGWLATGDIAERDADGFFWIRGRSKDMYISGGENVYPAEVEEVLAGHEAIAEAAVIGVADQRWGETGLAFVVFRPGRALSASDLSGYCRARLAAYKVPSHFRTAAELPRLTSGKLDKVTLRSMVGGTCAPAPSSTISQMLWVALKFRCARTSARELTCCLSGGQSAKRIECRSLGSRPATRSPGERVIPLPARRLLPRKDTSMKLGYQQTRTAIISGALVAAAALAVAGCSASSGGDSLALAGATSSSTTQASSTLAGNYQFVMLNDARDRTFNQLLGINNEGIIAGYFGSGAARHPNKGYALVPPFSQRNFLNENFPGSAQTQVTGLNDRGVTVGFWSTQNTANMTNNNFGFYWQNGRFHNVNFPTGDNARPPVNQLLGVNNSGIAVGFYTNGQGSSRGYEFNIRTHEFTRVLVPGAPSGTKGPSLTAAAINDNGDVAGFYNKTASQEDGFLKLRSGRFITLAFPGAAMTQALGVNDSDEVVGAYTTGSGNAAVTHGFVWRHGTFTTVDIPGASSTTINGVNDENDLVGFFTDAKGNTDGLLALPLP